MLPERRLDARGWHQACLREAETHDPEGWSETISFLYSTINFPAGMRIDLPLHNGKSMVTPLHSGKTILGKAHWEHWAFFSFLLSTLYVFYSTLWSLKKLTSIFKNECTCSPPIPAVSQKKNCCKFFRDIAGSKLQPQTSDTPPTLFRVDEWAQRGSIHFPPRRRQKQSDKMTDSIDTIILTSVWNLRNIITFTHSLVYKGHREILTWPVP